MRDNPGGYLTQAVDVANLFIKTGVIVEVQTSTAPPESASGKTVTDLPLVVLTNGYTSGAAEVLAAALQDNQRATIVGETTIGKGSVQVVHELSFGGAIRYTAGYYKSPLGHDIDGVGVIPDIAISLRGGNRHDSFCRRDRAKQGESLEAHAPFGETDTRRVARSRPRGIMQLNPEGYGFVRTSEGEFFVPHAKLGGAFDGDLVEVAPLPANASKRPLA